MDMMTPDKDKIAVITADKHAIAITTAHLSQHTELRWIRKQ